MKGIADTGFLVAFIRSADQHHEWATKLAKQFTEPLLTCEAVLAETAFHLASATMALSMLQRKLVTVALNMDLELDRLAMLADRYADREPDLADLCLIRLSELHPRHSVITVDVNDFRVYRRNGREVIPLIHPPGL